MHLAPVYEPLQHPPEEVSYQFSLILPKGNHGKELVSFLQLGFSDRNEALLDFNNDLIHSLERLDTLRPSAVSSSPRFEQIQILDFMLLLKRINVKISKFLINERNAPHQQELKALDIRAYPYEVTVVELEPDALNHSVDGGLVLG